MKDKLKNFFSTVLRFGISFALLAFIFSKIDTTKTLEALKTADFSYVMYALLIFIGIYFLLLWRWIILIRALNLSAGVSDVARFYFAALFGNLFLPSAIGGDIIKIVGLCRNSDQKPRVVASVLVDRLSGFASIVIVGVLSFIFGFNLIQDMALLVSIVILASASLVVVFILFNKRAYQFVSKLFKSFPKIENGLMQMHYDVMLLKDRKKEAMKAIFLSCLNQVFLSFCFFLISKALHQDISFIYFLIFVPLLCVVSTVPSIGGLGPREAGAAYLFGKAGMVSGIAVSMSLINFLFMVIVGLMGGLYYVLTLSSRRV
jgi:uncharacterized protein (TIRG00374 family)